jgi:hypothetical protein
MTHTAQVEVFLRAEDFSSRALQVAQIPQLTRELAVGWVSCIAHEIKMGAAARALLTRSTVRGVVVLTHSIFRHCAETRVTSGCQSIHQHLAVDFPAPGGNFPPTELVGSLRMRSRDESAEYRPNGRRRLQSPPTDQSRSPHHLRSSAQDHGVGESPTPKSPYPGRWTSPHSRGTATRTRDTPRRHRHGVGRGSVAHEHAIGQARATPFPAAGMPWGWVS